MSRIAFPAGASSACVLVWYRVDPQRSDECRHRQELLRERVLARCPVPVRFGWRDETHKHRRTWLESWDPVSNSEVDDFVQALDADARDVGLLELAPDGRFVDVFEWVGERPEG